MQSETRNSAITLISPIYEFTIDDHSIITEGQNEQRNCDIRFIPLEFLTDNKSMTIISSTFSPSNVAYCIEKKTPFPGNMG